MDDNNENEKVDHDRKTLIQELENTGDEIERPKTCNRICSTNKFLCMTPCTCIDIESRCDGTVRKTIYSISAF